MWLLCVLLLAWPAWASQTRTCVFDSSRSKVLQTGGLPSVHIEYAVRGWFQLTVDPDARTASFDAVDANLLDDKGNIYGYSLNQIFNLADLTGAIIDDATMEFVGKNVGRTQSDVRLTFTLANGSARLTGQVTPPPNSSDMTFYDLDADATMSTPYGPGGPGKPGEILFRFDADGEIISTPSIADDGTIYFGTLNATLYAIDRNGNLKWQWKYDCNDRWCPQAFESSPAIGDDGTIYVGDDVSIPNYFFAISPEGQKKWEYTTSILWGSMDASPALLSDGTIFVGANGFSFGAGPHGQLVALTPAGTVLDGFPLSSGAIIASPVAVDDLVIVGETGWRRTRNKVFAVKKSGNIFWRTELYANVDGSRAYSVSSLAVDRRNNIYIANNCQDYFPQTGPPILSSDIIQLDAQTGKQLCEIGIPTQSIVVGSPVIEAAGQDANVIVATENGHVISLTFYADGPKLNYDLALGENGEAVGSPVLGDNGKLYHAVNSTNDVNQIDVFEINADGTISDSFHVLIFNDHVTSSLSMDDNGVIYFGTKAGKLFAVQTGAGGLSKTAPWPTFRHDRKNTGNSEGPFVNGAPQSRGPEPADQ
jgi:hypothetical protein